jgi:hypothetical protein
LREKHEKEKKVQEEAMYRTVPGRVTVIDPIKNDIEFHLLNPTFG